MPHRPFEAWLPYYTVIGTSAAALIGLMFVVITLVGDRRRRTQVSSDGVSVFSTPTVVHFGTALIVSACMCAPWTTLMGPALLLGGVGLVGALHLGRASRRTAKMDGYTPDLEDWGWYVIVPFATYALMIVASIGMFFRNGWAVAAAAVATALLVVIGVRNSWDVVTYVAVRASEDDE